MTTSLVPAGPHLPAAELKKLNDLPTDRLKDELGKSLQLTSNHLVRLATIVRVLEERGEDLSELRIGLLGYLRRIAYGQVLPEVVVRYAEFPLLIQRIAALPLPEQQRLGAGEPVKVMVAKDDHRLVDPLKMTRDQVGQVFARDHIRDEAEQLQLLQERTGRQRERKLPARRRVRADLERGGIVIGRVYADAGDVLAALGELKGMPKEGGNDETVQRPVSLSDAEWRRLKVLAVKSGTSMSALVRRALWTAGLLAEEEP